MSKMSQLHAELTERAYELGYPSLADAMANGYIIDYENATLVDGRELAHNEWVKKRKEVLESLSDLADEMLERRADEEADTIIQAIDFIKRGELTIWKKQTEKQRTCRLRISAAVLAVGRVI